MRAWYDLLLRSAIRSDGDGADARAFDAHVVACGLAIALDERDRGEASLAEATGLSAVELSDLAGAVFSSVPLGLCDRRAAPDPDRAPEEDLLRDLLLAHTAPTAVSRPLATLIARRAMRSDHLWQDLGLVERADLSRLLGRHFPTLAAGNTGNMRWKKYFYRRLCEAEGFSLCSAPSCAQCGDFHDCFGAEDGESRLAAHRRALDLADRAPLAAE